MVQVSYPGVYIQEKSSGVNTITGVSTSIATFIGRTTNGPMNKPVRCLSFADFQRTFTGAPPTSEMAISVRQFFDNGGTDCYVVRLAGTGAQNAVVDLQNWAHTNVLRASTKTEGLWGNGVRLVVDYNTPNPGETFNLSVTQEEGGKTVATEVHVNLSMDPAAARFAPNFVTQSSALLDLDLDAALDLSAGSFAGYSEGRRPLGENLTDVQNLLQPMVALGSASGQRRFEISVNGSDYVLVDLTGWDVTVAADLPALAIELQGMINTALSILVPAQTVSVEINADIGTQYVLRIIAAGGDTATVKIRRSASQDISTALMLGVDNGGIEMARRSDFRPAPTGTVLRIEDGSGGLGPLNAFAALEQDQLTSIQINGESAITITDIETTNASDEMYMDNLGSSSPNANLDGVREKLQIISQLISNAPGSAYRAEVHGHQLVILAKDGTFNTVPASIVFAGPSAAAVNANLQLNTRQYTLGPDALAILPGGGNAYNSNFRLGNDGNAPGFTQYLGSEVEKTGFYALDTVDLFNLMVLPADSELDDSIRRQLWGPASIYCQSRRAFLIIDAPDSWVNANSRAAVVQNTADINNLRATVVKDYSAVYYPKIKFNDAGIIRNVGASGAIAGLMARTDATRGVWKAPAGTEADLRGIAGIQVALTDLENGVLNKLAVNCLRGFPVGFVNWGARTMDGSDDIGSEWKYVPIRRLALLIEESLYRGTQWVVFEPNDEPLWAKIRLNVGVFMNQLFRQGAFQGSTPDQAYFVKCDAENTTQADRNLGIVNIDIGFAPLKPAEFVIITIQQIAGDLL